MAKMEEATEEEAREKTKIKSEIETRRYDDIASSSKQNKISVDRLVKPSP